VTGGLARATTFALAAAALGSAAQPTLAPAAAAKKAAPKPMRHDAGFELALPDGWRQVEQNTGGGDDEPLLKVTSDASNQWLVVVKVKGPTDDAWDKPEVALKNFESGFATAPGYVRISLDKRSLPRRPGAKSQIPAADLWFSTERAGAPVTVGARALFFKGYSLTLVVDSPGKKPSKAAKAVLGSFVPSLIDD
jgi:hypothetical protein